MGQSSRKRAGITFSLKVYLSFAFIGTALKSLLSISEIVSITARETTSRTERAFWLALLAMFETISLCYKSYVLSDLWASAPRLSPECITDFCLLLTAIDVPIFNTMAAHAFPGFLRNKNFFASYAFIIFAGSIVSPPAHSLILWLLSSPPFM
jgi:hypothetical protein